MFSSAKIKDPQTSGGAPMSSFELRPLSLGELLDRAFLLYRRNFLLIAGIMLIPAVLLLPTQFFLLRSQGAALPWSAPLPQTRAVIYSYVIRIIYWFILAVVQAATTFAVSDTYLGRPSTVREAYGRVRGRIGGCSALASGSSSALSVCSFWLASQQLSRPLVWRV
jgi:hypothetical protein